MWWLNPFIVTIHNGGSLGVVKIFLVSTLKNMTNMTITLGWMSMWCPTQNGHVTSILTTLLLSSNHAPISIYTHTYLHLNLFIFRYEWSVHNLWDSRCKCRILRFSWAWWEMNVTFKEGDISILVMCMRTCKINID